MKKILASLALATFTTAALTACGGSGTKTEASDRALARPTLAEVKTSLVKFDPAWKNPKLDGALTCMAETMVNSKISDKSLNAALEGTVDFDANPELLPEADRAIVKSDKFNEKMSNCIDNEAMMELLESSASDTPTPLAAPTN